MIVDLQVSVADSGGEPIAPELLIKSAKDAGLDAVVLTAVDSVPDIADYKKEGDGHGLLVFGGAQVATNNGLILCLLPDGEMLTGDWAEKEDGRFDANSVIDAVETQGGVTVALRPYDRDVEKPMGDHLFSLQGLSACEVQSGAASEVANDLALEAASNLEMPCVGSSAADKPDKIGRAATLLRSRADTQGELCDLIRNGDCWPLNFSDDAPRGDVEDRPRRGGRGRGRGRGNEDSRRSSGGGGRDRRGGRGNGSRYRDGNKGGGRGRGRPLADDYGNRVSASGSDERQIDDDIGNQLAPGERNAFSQVGQPAGNEAPPREHLDDDVGNV